MKKLIVFLLLVCSTYANSPLPLDDNVISYFQFEDIIWDWPTVGTDYDVIHPSYQMRIDESVHHQVNGFVGEGLEFTKINSTTKTFDALPIQDNDYTIEVLINWHDTSDFSGVVYSAASEVAGNSAQWNWGFDNGRMYLGNIYYDVFKASAYTFESNKWYYLAYTYGFARRPDSVMDTQIKYYINGVEIFSIFGYTATGSSTSYLLGSPGITSGVPSIIGKLDEFRISNITRTPDDISSIWDVITGTSATELSPITNTRISVYPNPFTSAVVFGGDCAVNIYDVTGRLINRISGQRPRWTGKDLTGQRVAPGTYLYRTPDQTGTLLLK